MYIFPPYKREYSSKTVRREGAETHPLNSGGAPFASESASGAFPLSVLYPPLPFFAVTKSQRLNCQIKRNSILRQAV